MSAEKRTNRVFDYFFVCGVPRFADPCILINSKASDNEKTIDDILLKPTLLEHYPETIVGNSWDCSVQDTLTQLCHPGGISLTIDNATSKRIGFHSFLLTRQDGFRTYGHVLTYYETLFSETSEQIRQLCGSQVSVPNCKIYVQKSICLVTRLAYINTSEKVLRLLHRIFVTEKNLDLSAGLPIESYILNLLFEMPIPSPGNSLALLWNSERPVIVHQPTLMELPLIDIHLSSLFSLLGGPVNVLRLLTSAFLEHQILLISRDCCKLILVAEAISALMLPFQWPHTYAPVLPYKLAHHFLDAPVPYIMGIHLGSSEEKRTRLISKFDQCFVDIDKTMVECPEDQPNFPNQTVLVQQLNKVLNKHKHRISDIQKDKALGESGLLLAEDVLSPSPPLHRRNAQKRQSKVYEDKEGKVSIEIAEQKNNDDKERIDAIEELKNLHAVSVAPVKNSEISSQVSELKSIKGDEEEIQEYFFNIRVREIILGSLVSLFSQYDKFVIHPETNEKDAVDSWFLTRETQQNFDKASFLSDQPECHLRFLSAFLETQTFASLIDNRIVSQLEMSVKDPYLRLFDDRIKQAKNMPRPERPGAVKEMNESEVPASMDFLSRSLSIISAGQSAKLSVEKWIKSSEGALKRRFTNLSGRYPRLRALKTENEDEQSVDVPGKPKGHMVFPDIQYPSLLLTAQNNTEQKILQSSTIAPDVNWQQLQETRKKLMRQPSMSEFSPEVIAQTNWKFLEKLLKDVKLKTKKLLVRKMGQEAIELGHTESSIMGLEENTLIGSLCDLLERIWCHGLHANHKKGKSALWSHLLRYEEDSRRIMHVPMHEMIDTVGGSRLVARGPHHHSMSSLISPDQPLRLSPDLGRKHMDDHHFDRRYSQPVISSDGQYIMPVSTDIINNIKRIQQLKEVQTDVGKCRAWIRLSLEQKQLQIHLKKLLSNRPLLQTMYKRYSLLRCDDEREQFLYHLLSLNAVDFSCFTNSFTKTVITYRVWIYPKKQLSGVSQTSANVYITISGELACTTKISVPKGCTEFSFQHQNLGVMTTMILGHDNAGLLPKWLVDFVLIRNEVTGQAYYLPCGRWLGRNVDDGSMQRLLLAHTIPRTKDLNEFIYDHTNGKNQLGTSGFQKVNTTHELHERVGQAVNVIVKYFHRPTQEKIVVGALTPLLCRQSGLIPALTQVFQHGLKSTGFFRKQVYAWDVVNTACQILSGKPIVKQEVPLYKSTLSNLGDMIRNVSPQRMPSLVENPGSTTSSGRSSPLQTARDDDGMITSFESTEDESQCRLLELYTLISREQFDSGLGKDDMFQLLMCVGLKAHLLPNWLRSISNVIRQSTQLYERDAVMCNIQSISFLCRVLNNLAEYKIDFEPILLRGLDSLLDK